MDKLKITEMEKDIEEMRELVNTEPFNQNKAKNFIEKYKGKDANVALVNSPINPNFVLYQNATDTMLKNAIIWLMNYLTLKLLKETDKG